MKSWGLLLLAGATEVLMAFALKRSQSWTQWWPSVLGIAFALASIFLLTLALQRLPLSTAYAVWTGLGAVGVVLTGVLVFGETLSVARLACIALVVAGSVGLRLLPD